MKGNESLWNYWLEAYPDRSDWQNPRAEISARPAERGGVAIHITYPSPRDLSIGNGTTITADQARALARELQAIVG